ncbi:hypothetical protein M422DRAFT_268825 [Sphaerobolus stellatus SS14]|uniref:Uncharacterized protein n=1 Tax=Sphaerobolus stellatus (strain SS14) TaxID=990650 RepID=A0A0C9ULJ2_SPHS4|nr:hypothetical protein M422DRAFT_268825 [Sphaerobolus stellatus SS14]
MSVTSTNSHRHSPNRISSPQHESHETDNGSRGSSANQLLLTEEQLLGGTPSTPIDWEIKQPLYEKETDIHIDDIQPHCTFPSALHRKTVMEYPVWNERRNSLLILAEANYDCSHVAAARPLHHEIEHSFRDIMLTLTEALKLIRCRPSNCAEDEPFGFALDPTNYGLLSEKIQEAIHQRRHLIEDLPMELPEVPTWLGDAQKSYIWKEQEAELFTLETPCYLPK